MARMKIVKLKEFFGLMEKDGLAVPDLVRSLGDTISISIGHKFWKLGTFSPDGLIRIHGNPFEDADASERMRKVQTVLHEVGHYVSLRADGSIIDAYTDAIYPTDAALSTAGIPFVMDRLSGTRWHNHAKKRVYERNPEYRKFEGFELYFLPDDKPTWVGIWCYLTSIGDKRMKGPMRYVKPGTRCVTEYAWTNRKEDFAEHFAFFALHPEKVREASLEKHAFMEKLFSERRFHLGIPESRI